MDSMKKRVQGLLFIAVLALGAGLRFHALDRQSLWDDEMSTRKDISIPATQLLNRFETYEMHPPLYFVQLKIWQRLTGTSLTAQRANSALWGTFSLLLIFLVARRYYDAEAGLTAMALLALSPYHLAYSQELRPYAMAITLGLLGFLVLFTCLREDRSWRLLGLIFILELYTHYWGSFVMLAQLAVGYQLARRTEERRQNLLKTSAAASLVFALWLPVLFKQMQVMKGWLAFWVPPASPVNLARTSMAYTGLFFNHAAHAFHAPGLKVWVGLLGMLTWFLAALGLWIRPRISVIWLSVGLGVPFVLSFAINGLYVWYRYPVLMYPAFLLAVALGIRLLPGRWFQAAGLVLLLGQSAWSCSTYFLTWQKANPKDVVAHIQGLKGPDTVVVRPTYFADLFSYYDAGPTEVINEDQLDQPDKRAQLKGKNILFIAFDVPSDPVGQALLSEYKLVSAHEFPGFAHLGITVYQLH
jgi:mannosyltransferase